MNQQRQPLSGYDYDVQAREIAKLYDMISAKPDLAETRLGRLANARLDTLSPNVNPTGPNAPLVRGLERLVR